MGGGVQKIKLMPGGGLRDVEIILRSVNKDY